ncbi:hypothetical protein [Snodgrassella alvi]|jgi:hypothetical protein|uniref:hypothetical protein n=1 Tax=Snodgrassella alvi TaxID=1196083 RepID=UPI0015D52F7E|nr:hypothetical protein [Snodgrassella alvi]
MLEAKKVSKSEIQAWRKQIENGDLNDVGKVYQHLAKLRDINKPANDVCRLVCYG